MNTCRLCGAKILWVELKSGKKMPCDPEQYSWDDVDEGMVVVGQDGIVRNSRGNVLDDEQSYYVSHFATCPKADEARKAR